MIIISDTHIATQRQAGTTPASQIALKSAIQDDFRRLVDRANGQHLVINGDLFDGFSVDPGEVIKVYETLADHLHNGGRLTVIAGNHDHAAKADKTSSFQLLAHIISRYSVEVDVIDHTTGLAKVCGGSDTWAISHCLNQSLFDMEIEKAIATPGKFLLLHCNIMSGHCEHADHSLNLSETQLDALVEAGWSLIVGHEHQFKRLKAGKCLVPGNQIVTSISDCLNNKDNAKFYVKLEDGVAELVKWCEMSEIYTEVNWQDIPATDLESFQFIRVTGDCTADQAALMVNAIAKLRQSSSAYVISNAVKVEGVAQMEGLAEMSLSEMSKFDVLGALLEEMTEREQKTIKELLK